MKVDIFVPCFIDQLFPETAFNMIKVLEKAGCQVNYNPNQTCCGQPAYNAGYWDDARKVGEKFIEDFHTSEKIVSPSGSCVGFIRNSYDELFANSSVHNQFRHIQANLYEFSELLVDQLGVTDLGSTFSGKVTYHDACGALRECKIKEAPRTLMSKVRSLELIEMEASETCCGFGGTFTVKFPDISAGMADQKVQHALDTGAEYMVSTDWSCLMHLKAYIDKNSLPLKVMHLADVLAVGL